MSKITIPVEPCEFDPLKLVTMTISANIENERGPQYFNLDVLSRRTPLSDTIIGIHYRDIHRGQSQGKDTTYTKDAFAQNEEQPYDPDQNPIKSGNFKNQCTFIINDGVKIINTKLFNNGKLVNVGCKDMSHAIFAANTLLPLFTNMVGHVRYKIRDSPAAKSMKELKKFFKDDLKKKFSSLIQLLIFHLDLKTNLSCFDPSISADESFAMFNELIEKEANFIKDIMYVYTIINILKCYYNETDLINNFGTANFQHLLNIIIENSDREAGYICYEFPAYLNNHESIKFDVKTVKTVLINKSTNCNYYINRPVLKTILERHESVIKCTFDKSKYPGVLAQLMTQEGKAVKIIIFNTGKINITAADTHGQVKEAYEFIKEICIKYFNDLLLKSEYQNKIKEYEDSLPDQHYVGVINDQAYYLLYKVRILSNPRNVMFLHKLNLIDKYS